jgi:hypothetical protein
MKSKRLLSVLMMILFSAGIFAQNEEDEAAKAKETLRRKSILIESLISDTRELKLGENRAIMFAKIGGFLWDIDQKRARGLYQNAVGELVAAQSAAEAARKPGQQSELLTGQSTRPHVLQAIAVRDAEFALQSFYKTRPSLIERAITNVGVSDSKIRNHAGASRGYAQGELQLEQMLIRMAADQNPEKTVELLKSALKNGVTGETLGLLKKLFEKDPAAAAGLASDIAGQLLRMPLIVSDQPDYNLLHLITVVLSEHVQEQPAGQKSFRFDASQMGSLAEKLIAFHIEKSGQFNYGSGPQIIKIAEKFAPSSVEKLKQMEKAAPHIGWGRHIQNPELSRLLNSETPVEQMLAGAGKLPVNSRMQVYQSAANRLGSAGDISRARNVLSEYLSDEALENAEASLNYSYIQHLKNSGRFTEAEAIIDELPDANRGSELISLAMTAYGRDEVKNKSYAASLIDKARTQLPSKPETSNEMSQLIQIISSYSRMEPSEAFRMFEGLVQPINEIAEAAIIVNGFQGGHSVRQGEMVVSQGSPIGIYFDSNIFRHLAQIDFDETLSIIGGISRREMRLSMKQQMLEGL